MLSSIGWDSNSNREPCLLQTLQKQIRHPSFSMTMSAYISNRTYQRTRRADGWPGSVAPGDSGGLLYSQGVKCRPRQGLRGPLTCSSPLVSCMQKWETGNWPSMYILAPTHATELSVDRPGLLAKRSLLLRLPAVTYSR